MAACGDPSPGSSGGGADGGGGNSSTGLLDTGEGPCESADECAGNVCVALIDGDHPPNYCTQECGSCPDGFVCDTQTFQLVGLSFCRFGDDPEELDPPEEPATLPCTSDTDCDTGVCATYEGVRQCTIACSAEEQCTVDLGVGLVLDAMNCEADQTPSTDRTVCLPDPACAVDIQRCTTVPDPF